MRALLLALVALSSVPVRPAQTVTSGSTAGNTVAITFDAGADRGYAPSILQTLRRYHVHATFGMTGKWATENPDLIKQMMRDGDTFINHTYDHRSFTGLSSRMAPLTLAQRRWEINSTERVIHRLTGETTRPLFRPPFGDYDRATLDMLPGLGYRYMVMWTVDSLGWRRVPAATILQHCLLNARPGAIVLMHVGSQSQDALALAPFLAALQRRHFRFVTVQQMLHVTA